jgi:hypothetical protein
MGIKTEKVDGKTRLDLVDLTINKPNAEPCDSIGKQAKPE